MPPTNTLAQFAVAAFIIIVVPGPSVLFTVSRGITLGRRAAIANVVGNTLGAISCAVVVSVGLGPVIERSDIVFNILKIVGAVYLMHLGYLSLRDRKKLALLLDGVVDPVSTRVVIRQGFVVGVTNPKIYVFFAAVLPQYVDRTSGTAIPQMLVLALVFATIAFLSDCVWGLLAGTIRAWLSGSPRRLEAVGGVGGLAIIGLGLRLAFTRSNR